MESLHYCSSGRVWLQIAFHFPNVCQCSLERVVCVCFLFWKSEIGAHSGLSVIVFRADVTHTGFSSIILCVHWTLCRTGRGTFERDLREKPLKETSERIQSSDFLVESSLFYKLQKFVKKSQSLHSSRKSFSFSTNFEAIFRQRKKSPKRAASLLQ